LQIPRLPAISGSGSGKNAGCGFSRVTVVGAVRDFHPVPYSLPALREHLNAFDKTILYYSHQDCNIIWLWNILKFNAFAPANTFTVGVLNTANFRKIFLSDFGVF
jgi:hypothetical protein